MDASAMYPRGFHPVQLDFLPDIRGWAHPLPRLFTPVRYYYVDFGLSVKFPPEKYPKTVTGADGQDQEVPELSWKDPYDPFKVDIFILGNVFRQTICAVGTYFLAVLRLRANHSSRNLRTSTSCGRLQRR